MTGPRWFQFLELSLIIIRFLETAERVEREVKILLRSYYIKVDNTFAVYT